MCLQETLRWGVYRAAQSLRGSHFPTWTAGWPAGPCDQTLGKQKDPPVTLPSEELPPWQTSLCGSLPAVLVTNYHQTQWLQSNTHLLPQRSGGQKSMSSPGLQSSGSQGPIPSGGSGENPFFVAFPGLWKLPEFLGSWPLPSSRPAKVGGACLTSDLASPASSPIFKGP